MSKTIFSPVAKWKGSVVIADPLTFPQATAVEDAIEAARGLDTVTKQNAAMLPGICACVEKWELEGLGQLTPETFPSTPRIASAKLIAWLIEEIGKLYQEGDEIPNA